MNLSTRISRLHGFGKAILAGTLAVLLFISALAAGSPTLHQRLHSDHGSPTHFCLISTLDHGHTHAPGSAAIFIAPVEGFPVHTPLLPFTCASPDFRLFCGRGPPSLA